MYVSLFPVSFCLFSFPVSTYGFYIAPSFLLLMLTYSYSYMHSGFGIPLALAPHLTLQASPGLFPPL